jgi:hypothetical protein
MNGSWFTVKLVCVWVRGDDDMTLPEGYRLIGSLVLNHSPMVGVLVGAPVEWLQKVSAGHAMSLMCDALKRELVQELRSGRVSAVLAPPGMVC